MNRTALHHVPAEIQTHSEASFSVHIDLVTILPTFVPPAQSLSSPLDNLKEAHPQPPYHNRRELDLLPLYLNPSPTRPAPSLSLLTSDDIILTSLLRFLDRLSAHIPIDISSICSLRAKMLDSLPPLLDRSWDVLLRQETINPTREVSDSALNEAALTVSCAEKDGVDDQEDPASLLEGNGRQQDAEPEENL